MTTTEKLQMMPLEEVSSNVVALRKVNTEKDQYQDLKASIKDRGVMNPINLRFGKDTEGNEGFVIVDGLHRYTAACELGFEEIPVQILDLTEAEALEAQIEANLMKVPTSASQYAKQLERILNRNPERTLKEQAKRVHKSVGWLKDMLSLTHLDEETQKLLDEGKIGLSASYALAKLAKVDPAVAKDYVDAAQNKNIDEFLADVLERVAEIKKAQREDRAANPATGPRPVLRKKGEVMAELDRASKDMTSVPANKREFAEGYLTCLQWVLKQDAVTIEAWKREQAEKEAKKAAKAAEKEAAAAG